ncbi:Os05g0513150 [Oryza sativa Japonica Group]|uniref:Os05g0513150 protein n=1 Tax=Oryza sativa subsp. japonica TaxID=39947 RepID=A0A0N7KL28_ORYSJ|nr:Os05g0513150 [Oryza sativa Japonica Group]
MSLTPGYGSHDVGGIEILLKPSTFLDFGSICIDLSQQPCPHLLHHDNLHSASSPSLDPTPFPLPRLSDALPGIAGARGRGIPAIVSFFLSFL